jgi:transcriptional regulator with XRE-family HTH domain
LIASVHVPKAPPSARSLFAARLKQARAVRGVPSQRALGVLMGLNKKLASSRINRYENETSGIDLDALGKLAQTLNLPMAFLVAEDDLMAQAILALSQLPKAKRARAVEGLLELVKVKSGEEGR